MNNKITRSLKMTWIEKLPELWQMNYKITRSLKMTHELKNYQNSDNETGVAFVTSSDDSSVISLPEIFSQFIGLKFKERV